MDQNWLRQTKEKPLFDDLLWSQPENKKLAGKLLIVGGNLHGFAAPAEAYSAAVSAGIGSVRVLLPDKLQKSFGASLDSAYFEPSNPSGSFSKSALAGLLEHADWADGVLFAGDLGRNSETAILVESFLRKFGGLVTITKDAADYFTSTPGGVLERKDTLLVISLSQLQRLGVKAHFPQAFTYEMDFFKLAENLAVFSKEFGTKIEVKHLDTVFVADQGKVSGTKSSSSSELWRVKAASSAAVWWLQNPKKSFEALTTSALSLV